jgi:tetratricopeptide (TPR) repeat protein
MSTRRALLLVLLLLFAIGFGRLIFARPVSNSSSQAAGAGSVSPSVAEALTLYQRGNFDAAADMYREILKADPKNSDAYVGLTRTLLKQKKVDEARAIIDKAIPIADSSKLRIAAAEVDFREGQISEAEREWVNIINSGRPDGRAFLGLARVSAALSLYRRAQTMLERAHAADPDDADIRKAWMRTLKRSERIKYLEEYLSQGNADDAESRAHMQQYLEYLEARSLGPTPGCRLVGNVTSAEAPLLNLLSDPSHLRGYGLEVDFGNQKSKLLLDTGAGGILINRRIAEKAGLKQISATTLGGLGDHGEARGYVALAHSIRVGGLEFQDCPVEVIDRRSVVDEDGSIGADVFEKFLVHLDFAHQKLRLSELPKRPGQNAQDLALTSDSDDQNSGEGSQSGIQNSDSQGAAKPDDKGPFDHYIAPEMKNYSQVLRFGHMLLIPTWVNDEKLAKFFLIDSGDFTTQLSLNAAKSVTKVHNDSGMHVKGVSGEVNKVYVADEATLVFAHLRQPTRDAIVLDLKHLSDNVGTEVSGIIGFTTLRFLNVDIDYRDGLVFMQYQGPKSLVR